MKLLSILKVLIIVFFLSHLNSCAIALELAAEDLLAFSRFGIQRSGASMIIADARAFNFASKGLKIVSKNGRKFIRTTTVNGVVEEFEVLGNGQYRSLLSNKTYKENFKIFHAGNALKNTELYSRDWKLITNISKDKPFIILEENAEWSWVRINNNLEGYIRNKVIQEVKSQFKDALKEDFKNSLKNNYSEQKIDIIKSCEQMYTGSFTVINNSNTTLEFTFRAFNSNTGYDDYRRYVLAPNGQKTENLTANLIYSFDYTQPENNSLGYRQNSQYYSQNQISVLQCEEKKHYVVNRQSNNIFGIGKGKMNFILNNPSFYNFNLYSNDIFLFKIPYFQGKITMSAILNSGQNFLTIRNDYNQIVWPNEQFIIPVDEGVEKTLDFETNQIY